MVQPLGHEDAYISNLKVTFLLIQETGRWHLVTFNFEKDVFIISCGVGSWWGEELASSVALTRKCSTSYDGYHMDVNAQE